MLFSFQLWVKRRIALPGAIFLFASYEEFCEHTPPAFGHSAASVASGPPPSLATHSLGVVLYFPVAFSFATSFFSQASWVDEEIQAK